VFRVLRRIFGPKRDEVTGEWRKLNSEEKSLMIGTRNQCFRYRRMRMAGHVAGMGEEERCIWGFGGET
jgi:hypothetical protein